jgi:predicted nucleic acid-binding protein
MIVLDTTVLVYAKGSGHPLRGPCRELIAEIAGGSVEATTTVEAIQEFAHLRAQRRDREDAASLARDYAELLSPLLKIDRDVLSDGLTLFERVPALGAFDAVLAAGAIAAGAEALVSADRDFADVIGLPHVFPDADGVAALRHGR